MQSLVVLLSSREGVVTPMSQEPPLSTPCPCCGEEILAAAERTNWGLVVAGPILPESGYLHRGCDLDLMRIGRLLRVEAERRSRICVFTLFGLSE